MEESGFTIYTAQGHRLRFLVVIGNWDRKGQHPEKAPFAIAQIIACSNLTFMTILAFKFF
ncbi:MAG TPA: hypothetical protein DDW76_36695 [Cyanobacteria bacterium UBA11369]|nr:hypothetical protein [Cyanobacteria bacterium UBA11371]HBE35011.1 hypothetical protein [Cyanobacteria bacterium UBA11368]HBE54145.1 hypothetical protein [Cyanobacteria bacterium UBA11369]